jgi:hypothetical protein
MPRKWVIALIVFSSLLLAQSQDLKVVTQKYKPGDTVRYRVEFDGAPNFERVNLGFYLEGNLPSDQPGLSNYFAIDHTTKLKPAVFDVDGTIPNNTPNGTFEVRRIVATIPPASKEYDTASLHITIHIDNDAKYDFPPLKSITPQR